MTIAAAGTVLAVAAAGIPLGAAVAAATPAQTSAWGRHSPVTVPPVEVGKNRPAASVTTLQPGAARAHAMSDSGGSSASPLVVPPTGQGQVPWHQYSDTRLTDALVGRVDLSSGDFLLAGTDFDIAGAGDRLQLAQTYSSFAGAGGTVGDRWWLTYDRRLQVSGSDVYLIDSTGAAVKFTAGTGAAYTTPAGYSQDLVKNSNGTYTLTDRKSGSKDTYTSTGVLTKVTDHNGATITVTQHASGYKLTETRTGRSIDLAPYTATQWRATDNTGRYAKFDTDGYGNLVQTTDTAGKATQFGYEELSDGTYRVNKITSPEGNVTKLTYDAANRIRSLQRVANADGTGPTWTYTYSAGTATAAGTTTVNDPDLDVTIYTHDATGQVTSVEDPLHHKRSSTYDANHNVKTAVDAMGTGTSTGNTTTYGWDSRNNPTSTTLPTNATATFGAYATIAGIDLPPDFTDAQGHKTSFSYDTAGNTLSTAVTGDAAASRSYTYNPATPTCGGFQGQRCTAKDANSKTTTFHYDAKGNLDKVTPPAPLGATTYTYDDLGRPHTATDGRGITTTYTYDDRDRTTDVKTSGGAHVVYVFDGDGNQRSRTDDSGTTTYLMDKLNRETIRTLTDGSQTVLAYTPDGHVDTYTDPTGTVDYGYDTAGRMTSLKDPSGATTAYGYNDDDVRDSVTYPGGTVQTTTLDPSNRPKNIKTTNGTTTLVDLDYTYTSGPSGSDGTLIDTRTDHTGAATYTTYSYDSQNRLSSVGESHFDTKSHWVYCLDAAGNLTSQGSFGSCPATTTYNYNDASQLTAASGSTTDWSYNATGDETAANSPAGARTGETWSDFNQLTSLTTGGTTYTAAYSGTDNGERTRLGSTAFHNGPEGLAGSTTAGTDTGFTRDPQGTLNSMRTGGTSYYFLTDAQGSVVGLVNSAGTRVDTYTYDPTGQARTTTETVPQPYRFQGTYLDPTGLYKMGARYYDPTLGRFTQTDPSGKETNPYLFAGADPVNHTDPTGTGFLSSALEALGNGSDILDGISLGDDLYNKDWGAAYAKAMGIAAGALSLFQPQLDVAR